MRLRIWVPEYIGARWGVQTRPRQDSAISPLHTGPGWAHCTLSEAGGKRAPERAGCPKRECSTTPLPPSLFLWTTFRLCVKWHSVLPLDVLGK